MQTFRTWAFLTGACLSIATICSGASSVGVIIDSEGAGGGAPLLDAVAVAADSLGNVFVGGRLSDNVLKVEPNGTVTVALDAAGDGLGNGLDGPRDIAIDAADNLYVVGFDSDNAFRISATGVVTEIIDSIGDGTSLLDGPIAIAVDDSSGDVFVTAYLSDNAFRISSTGVVTEIIDFAGDGAGAILDGPAGVATDDGGNVLVVGSSSDNVFEVSPTGTITEILDASGTGAPGGDLDGPFGIAIDASDNIYVTSELNDSVLKRAANGVVTQVMSSAGDGQGNALNAPHEVAIDSVGIVYVTGLLSSNAFALDLTGTVTEVIDASGDGHGNTLELPFNLAIDSLDRALVVGGDLAFLVGSCGNGILEGSEDCDDGNTSLLDCCDDVCEFEPPSTPCNQTSLCTLLDRCDMFGECLSGGPPSLCDMPAKTRLKITDKNQDGADSKDTLLWKYIKGPAESQADFGDPTSSARYSLCVYAGPFSVFVMEATVEPGGTCEDNDCWSPVSTKGFKFKDKAGVQDGLLKVLLKGDESQAKTKILFKGKGASLNLTPSTLPLPEGGPVVVRVLNSDNHHCWGASYDAFLKNDESQFKARNP